MNTTTTAAGTSATEGPSRPLRLFLLGLALLPIVIAVVRALRHHWFPIGDNALLYLRARDVFTSHHPLLGSWTSASLSVGENMNNPGSMYDFLIAPFAHAFSPGPGAAIGVGSVNAASIVGVSIASRHIGGWSLQRWMLLAAAALSWSMGSEMLIDMFQAHALLLPFLLFLVLLVGCTAGRIRCLPWTVAVASLLIQTHISYAYILSLLAGAALVFVWWQHRPIRRLVRTSVWKSRSVLWSVITLGGLWIQPLIEQFFGAGRGNLTRLATNSGGGDFSLGSSTATKIMSSLLVLPEWWTRPGYSSTVPSTPRIDTIDGPTLHIFGLPGLAVAASTLTVVVVVLALLTRAAWRRGMTLQAAAGFLAACGVVAAVVSLSLLTVGAVGLSAHHVRWVWSLAVFIHVVALWIGCDLAVARHAHDARSADRRISWALAAGIAALSTLNLPYEAHPEGPVADYASMTTMRKVFPLVNVLRGHGPVVYDTGNLRAFEPYSSTMMMRMQEVGVEFRVTDEGMVRQLGNSRRANGSEQVTVFQLEASAALLYDANACPVAVASRLTDEQEQTARLEVDLLADDLLAGSIAVDDATIGADDSSTRLDAARSGDRSAALSLVLDGSITRWLAQGAVDSANSDQLAGRLLTVDLWVGTVYGLFATLPLPCP